MSTYLVSYDLMSPGQNYQKLHDYLRSFGTRAKVLESTWVLVTDLSATELRDRITAHMDTNDKLLVLKSGTIAAWRNLGAENSEWLKKYL